MKKRRWLLLSFLLVGLLILAELVARYYFGLGDIPIYIESAEYEYIYAPNQNVKRFGNTISTNKFSMRSKPLSKKDKVRVLLIGDSVINGGPHVDQKDLASTLLEEKLQQKIDGVRVLNISAGSWGPDNAFAYIEKHGDFEADLIVLAFSSHDYNDNMHFRKVVGEHRSWPDSKPFLAITDAFGKYIWPEVQGWFSEQNDYAYLDGFDDSAVNSGWKNFIDYCAKEDIQMLLYHHPEKTENSAKEFNPKGKRLAKLAIDNQVFYIDGISKGHKAREYRDEIHINKYGHRRLFEILYPTIDSILTRHLTP